MGMQFNRIIVGYDDTEGSKKALNLGIGLAKENPDSQLLVAQVFEEKMENIPVSNSNEKVVEPVRTNGYLLEGIQIPPLPVYHEEASTTTHAKVTHSVDQAFYNAREALEPYNINAKFDVLDGNPTDSICDYAAAEGADLIVVGNSSKAELRGCFSAVRVLKLLKMLHALL